MFSRSLLLRTPARALWGHVRCHPIPAAAQYGLEIRSVRSACRIPSTVSPFSSSCTLHDSPNSPGKSGDKGPAKNYRKKMRKKRKTVMASAEELEAILEGTRFIEALKSGIKQKGQSAEPNFDAILEGVKEVELAQSASHAESLKNTEESDIDGLTEEAKVIELMTSAEAHPVRHIASLKNFWEHREEEMECATGPAVLDTLTEGEGTIELLVASEDQPETIKRRGKDVEHTTAGPVTLDALTEEANTIEQMVPPQDQTKAVKREEKVENQFSAATDQTMAATQDKKVENKYSASTLEAIHERTMTMESLIDQCKDTEHSAMLTEGEKMNESSVASASEGQVVPDISLMKGILKEGDVMGGEAAREEQGGVDGLE